MEGKNDDKQRDTYVLYLLSSLIDPFRIARYNGKVGIFGDDHVGDKDEKSPNGIQELVRL